VRVLQVARYGSVRGGAETYIASLAHGLREAGHEVALAYALEPDPSREEVAAGFHVPALNDPAGDPAGFREAIERYRPDMVHVHLPDVPWVAPTAATRAPTLLAVHDHRLDCPVGTKYWAAWKRRCTVRPGAWCLGYNVVAHCGSLRANATLKPYRSWHQAREAAEPLRLQVFSRYMRDEIARSRFDPSRIGVTPYPVPAPVWPADPGETDRRPVVFTSGRLNKEKGFLEVIDALELTRRPVNLVIVGDGHSRAAIERRASIAGGGHRITFTGWLPAAQAAGWRQRALIVAVPSMWPEPFGIVGLEAMAAGKPVVAFDSGGIREWLADGETGRLVPAGDVSAFAAALRGLLDDDAMRERMGRAARARAESDFALGPHVRRVLALYEEVRAE